LTELGEMNTTQVFVGSVVVITGTSSGIGRECARAFATRGAKVVLASRREEENKQLVEEIRGAGGEVTFIQTDVSKEEDAQRLISHAIQTFGRVDILINNSGREQMQKSYVHELDTAEFDLILNVNIRGAFLVTKYFLKQVVKQIEEEAKQHPASIAASTTPIFPAEIPIDLRRRNAERYSVLHVSSIASMRGVTAFQLSSYITSKGALNSFSIAVACEYGKFGIRSNVIAPGWIGLTDMSSRVLSGTTTMPLDSMDAILGPNIPLGFVGEPHDIAGLAVFLASKDARYITGSLFRSDGGKISATN